MYAYIPFEKEELIIFNRLKDKETSLATTRGAKWNLLKIRDDKILLGRREGVHIHIEKWDETGILASHMIRPGENPAILHDFDMMDDFIKIRYDPQDGGEKCVELWACSNLDSEIPILVPFPDTSHWRIEQRLISWEILCDWDENQNRGYFAARLDFFVLIFRNFSAPKFIRKYAEGVAQPYIPIVKFSTVKGRKIMAAITFAEERNHRKKWWTVHIYDIETGEIGNVIVLPNVPNL